MSTEIDNKKNVYEKALEAGAALREIQGLPAGILEALGEFMVKARRDLYAEMVSTPGYLSALPWCNPNMPFPWIDVSTNPHRRWERDPDVILLTVMYMRAHWRWTVYRLEGGTVFSSGTAETEAEAMAVADEVWERYTAVIAAGAKEDV